jgi:hypothetical protein
MKTMPRGRPRKIIDVNTIAELAAIFCTDEEIAAEVDCSVKTLRNKYSVITKKERLKGKVKLRRMQWKSAEEGGNVSMQQFLGKQYLGQFDKMENSLNEEQYNELLTTAHAAMVHIAGAGRATSGATTVQK